MKKKGRQVKNGMTRWTNPHPESTLIKCAPYNYWGEALSMYRTLALPLFLYYSHFGICHCFANTIDPKFE